MQCGEEERRLREVADRLQHEVPAREHSGRDLAAVQERLRALAEAIARLHDLHVQLASRTALALLQESVLAEVLAVLGSGKGVVALYDSVRNCFHAGACAGFVPASSLIGKAPPGIDLFESEILHDLPVIVADLEAGPFYASHLAAARMAGYRALYAVPLTGRGGEILGGLIAYFAEPFRPSEQQTILIELHAHCLAQAMEIERLFLQLQDELKRRKRKRT